MIRKFSIVLLFSASLYAGSALGAPAAQAKTTHCRAGYVRKVTHVRRRRHGHVVRVRKVVCVRAKKVVAKPRPTVRYVAKVDPTFVQNPSNPLAVTYSYSASASAIVNGQATDLAAIGQLPAGVLNFYSAQAPGGPESLYCSANVGGASIGASCPITYAATGTYEVTTQYVPNAASAVTETDQETIPPFATTTTVTTAPTTCAQVPPNLQPNPNETETCYTMTTSAIDQNGVALTGSVAISFSGQLVGSVPVGKTCTLEVAYDPQNYSAGPTSELFSPDCLSGMAYLQSSSPGQATSWAVAAAWGGVPGWAPSTGSATVTP
jgi:hypothetical protein